MATKLLEILVLSIFLFNFVSSDIFDKIFQHDADPCKESCAKTYAPHTYEVMFLASVVFIHLQFLFCSG